MIDNDLYVIVRTQLLAQLARYGQPTWDVQQAFQPEQQGDNPTDQPCLYFHALPDYRYGWPQRKDIWSPLSGIMEHRESQQMEKTLQFNGVMQDTADNVSGLIVADMLKLAAQAFQSDTMMAAMRAQGLGVLRISQIRNVPIQNEQGNFAMNPSFDVVLTHRDDFEHVIGVVNAREVITRPI